jgi:hypothetical protein
MIWPRMFFAFLFSFFLTFGVNAQFTDAQSSMLALKNLYKNGSAELGKTGWSETGGGVLALETTIKRPGKASIKFTSSATSDYLNFPSVTVKEGTDNCETTIYYRTTSAVFDLEIYYGANRINVMDLPSTNGVFRKATLTFACSSVASAYQTKVTNGANGDIVYADDGYIGDNLNIGSVDQLDKEYDLLTACSGSSCLSGTNFSYAAYARAVPSVDRNGVWWLKGSAWIAYSNSTTTRNLNISGVAVSNLSSGEQSFTCSGSHQIPDYVVGSGNAGSTTFTCVYPSSVSYSVINFNVRLNSKPTWATDTASETVVRAESGNQFGALEWSNISSCAFNTSSPGDLTDSDCNTATRKLGSVSYGRDDYLELTQTNLRADWVYKVTVYGTAYGTAANIGIGDGTTNRPCSYQYASSGLNQCFAFFSYSSFQPSKTFTAKLISGTNVTIYADNAESFAGISIEPVYPTSPMPQIVNSVGTSYQGVSVYNSARVDNGSDAPCTSGPCSVSRSGSSWISSVGYNSTGDYTINFAAGVFTTNNVNCMVSSRSVNNNCRPYSETTSSASVYCSDTSTDTAANSNFNISCHGYK